MKTKYVLCAAMLCAVGFLVSGCVHAGYETLDEKTPCGEVHKRGIFFETVSPPASHDVQCPGQMSQPTAQYVPQAPYYGEQAYAYANPAPAVLPAPVSYGYADYGYGYSYSVPIYSYRVVWGGNCYVRQRYFDHYEYRNAGPRYGYAPPRGNYYPLGYVNRGPQRFYSGGRAYYINPPQPHVRIVGPHPQFRRRP